MRPSSGDGVAITNNGDDIGLFVDASDGNVGIGTTEPQDKLTVDGNVSATGGINAGGNPGSTLMWKVLHYTGEEGGKILHGLDLDKILSLSCLVDLGTWKAPGSFSYEDNYSCYLEGDWIVFHNYSERFDVTAVILYQD